MSLPHHTSTSNTRICLPLGMYQLIDINVILVHHCSFGFLFFRNRSSERLSDQGQEANSSQRQDLVAHRPAFKCKLFLPEQVTLNSGARLLSPQLLA